MHYFTVRELRSTRKFRQQTMGGSKKARCCGL